MSKDNGGSAFPKNYRGPSGAEYQIEGLTIRDYMAAKALQGLLSNRTVDLKATPINNFAKDAYNLADAMIRARGE